MCCDHLEFDGRLAFSDREGSPTLLPPKTHESMLQAARHGGRACRSLSLTATLQMLGNLWLSNAIRGVDAGLPELFLQHHITIKVGHRPGRNEPRANKRRPKILQLLTKPRHEAKAELESVA